MPLFGNSLAHSLTGDSNPALLVAAEAGSLRPFSGPDLSETHGLQCRRLSVRSDELVFDDARVRPSSRDTADRLAPVVVLVVATRVPADPLNGSKLPISRKSTLWPW